MKAFDKPLTAEEERMYLQKYKEGDMEAKRILIEKNMRLVAHMVKRYMSMERDMEDMISVGTIGLIKAINTFDCDKSCRIATYAVKCIDNELLMMIRQEKRKSKDISLYEPIGVDKEGNEINIIDVIKSDNEELPDICQNNDNVKKIYEIINKVLSKREKEIIISRYGLYNSNEATQKELATRMGISRSYVSRIEKRALEKLKKWL